MSDFDVLDRIENTHQATLTHPDGSPLTWLGQLAGAIYLTADFHKSESRWNESMKKRALRRAPERQNDPVAVYTRKQHAMMLGLMSMLGR